MILNNFIPDSANEIAREIAKGSRFTVLRQPMEKHPKKWAEKLELLCQRVDQLEDRFERGDCLERTLLERAQNRLDKVAALIPKKWVFKSEGQKKTEKAQSVIRGLLAPDAQEKRYARLQKTTHKESGIFIPKISSVAAAICFLFANGVGARPVTPEGANSLSVLNNDVLVSREINEYTKSFITPEIRPVDDMWKPDSSETYPAGQREYRRTAHCKDFEARGIKIYEFEDGAAKTIVFSKSDCVKCKLGTQIVSRILQRNSWITKRIQLCFFTSAFLHHGFPGSEVIGYNIQEGTKNTVPSMSQIVGPHRLFRFMNPKKGEYLILEPTSMGTVQGHNSVLIIESSKSDLDDTYDCIFGKDRSYTVEKPIEGLTTAQLYKLLGVPRLLTDQATCPVHRPYCVGDRVSGEIEISCGDTMDTCRDGIGSSDSPRIYSVLDGRFIGE